MAATDPLSVLAGAGAPGDVIATLAPAKVYVYDVEETAHASPHCKAIGAQQRMNGAKPRGITLGEYAATVSCASCRKRPNTSFGRFSPDPLTVAANQGIAVVTAAAKADRLLARLLNPDGRPVAVGGIRSASSVASNARKELAGRAAKAPAVVVEWLDEQVRLLDAAVGRLRAASRNDERRAAVAERVRRALVPDDWQGKLPSHDDHTLSIVGIHPVPGRGDLTGDVLAAFAVHIDATLAVLVAPRFVFDYLQRVSFPGSLHRSLIQAVPAALADGDDVEEVASMAARLWTPLDDGDLRDLGRAVEAAVALR